MKKDLKKELAFLGRRSRVHTLYKSPSDTGLYTASCRRDLTGKLIVWVGSYIYRDLEELFRSFGENAGIYQLSPTDRQADNLHIKWADDTLGVLRSPDYVNLTQIRKAKAYE